MVTTKFVGRLGNSMYQVAICIAYAKKFRYEWAVPFNSVFGNGPESETSIHRVFSDLPKTHDQPRPWPRSGFDPQWYDYFELQNMGPDVTLLGFWQSYKWFAHCEDEVRRVFSVPVLPEYKDFVSLHVRRGDFIRYAGSFPTITVDYLKEAIKHFDRPKLLVFSDDIGWCKANLPYPLMMASQMNFFEGDERATLQAMVSCSDHIISNSSFAWWGAWLGHNPNKKIVSPHHTEWYGPENGVVKYARGMRKEPCSDLIPPSWIQIKFR